MNNTIFTTTLPDGDFIAPAELVSPPPSGRVNSRALLWALTLLSFLGGTYYGYQFRKTAAPVDAHLVVVHSGGTLTARWDPKLPAFAAINGAQLRVNSGVRELVLPIDKATLQRGEMALNLDPTRSADVLLVGNGISSRARFLSGDPLESALIHADADSLRQQIADQQDLNKQMEIRLSQTR